MITRRVALGAVLVPTLCGAALMAPLALYATSLALFGLPHVLAELRYVDHRFRGRVGGLILASVLALLGALVIGRLAAAAGVSWVPHGAFFELVVLAALVAATIPALVRASRGGAMAAILVACGVGYGAAKNPVATLVLLSIAHNLTPVGFLAERLRGRERRVAMAWCAVVFVGVPALLLSGALGAMDLAADGGGALAAWTGPFADHLPVFVPSGMRDLPWAPRLFATAAYLQCIHYCVVLGILPRLQRADGAQVSTLVSWPSDPSFRLALLASGVLTAIMFSTSFRDARTAYAVVAAVHAFVEFPILLLACAPEARLKTLAAR